MFSQTIQTRLVKLVKANELTFKYQTGEMNWTFQKSEWRDLFSHPLKNLRCCQAHLNFARYQEMDIVGQGEAVIHKSNLLRRHRRVEWIMHHLWVLTVDLRAARSLLEQCTQWERRRGWERCVGRAAKKRRDCLDVSGIKIKINTSMRLV